MKVDANSFSNKTTDELLQEFKAHGINSTRLDKAISESFLPKSGFFTGYELMNAVDVDNLSEADKKAHEAGEKLSVDNFAYVAITFEDATNDKITGSISLSRLQMAGVLKSDFTPEYPLTKTAKNKFYLKGTALNPSLTGNQINTLQKLIGNQFEAEETILIRSKFSKNGYGSESAHVSEEVKSYKITL